MEVLLYTILTLCVLGVLAAIVLYFVARKFRVEEDPRIDVVEKMLPVATAAAAASPAVGEWPTRWSNARIFPSCSVRWAAPR